MALSTRVPFCFISKFSLEWKHNRTVILLYNWGWKKNWQLKHDFIVQQKCVFVVKFFSPPITQLNHNSIMGILSPPNITTKSWFYCDIWFHPQMFNVSTIHFVILFSSHFATKSWFCYMFFCIKSILILKN